LLSAIAIYKLSFPRKRESRTIGNYNLGFVAAVFGDNQHLRKTYTLKSQRRLSMARVCGNNCPPSGVAAAPVIFRNFLFVSKNHPE